MKATTALPRDFKPSLRSSCNRPVAVTADLFKGKVICDVHGNEQVVDGETAQAIYFDMVVNGYVDKKGELTDKYYADKANNAVKVAEEVADCADAVLSIVDSIYDSRAMQRRTPATRMWNCRLILKNWLCRSSRRCGRRSAPNLSMLLASIPKNLWKKRFPSLNRNLRVSKIFFKVELGTMNEIQSKRHCWKALLS